MTALKSRPEISPDSPALTPLFTPQATYELCALGPVDIPAMLFLQDEAADNQAVIRPAEILRAHFSAGGQVLGAYQDGRLAAQLMIGFSAAPDMATIGGVLTSPDHRGQGLMKELLTAALDIAAQRGCHTAHARVRCGNIASYNGFAKQGFCEAGQGPSPDDPDKIVHFLYKPLGPA